MARGSNCKNFFLVQQHPYQNLVGMKHWVWMLVWRLKIIPFRRWLAKHEYDTEYCVLTLATMHYVHTIESLLKTVVQCETVSMHSLCTMHFVQSISYLMCLHGVSAGLVFPCLSLVPRSEWNWMLALHWHRPASGVHCTVVAMAGPWYAEQNTTREREQAVLDMSSQHMYEGIDR